MAVTTIFLAYLLVWAVGANGFLQKQTPRVVSTSADALRKEWNGLAPPFNHEQSTHDDDDMDAWKDKQEDVTHFCFLVHGHRGYSKVHKQHYVCPRSVVVNRAPTCFLTSTFSVHRTCPTCKQSCNPLPKKKRESAIMKLAQFKTWWFTIASVMKARRRMAYRMEENGSSKNSLWYWNRNQRHESRKSSRLVLWGIVWAVYTVGMLLSSCHGATHWILRFISTFSARLRHHTWVYRNIPTCPFRDPPKIW